VNAGTAALIALVLGAVLTGAGYLFFIGWTKLHVSWLPLAGAAVAGTVYASAVPGFDAARLAAALNESRVDLLRHTRWTPEQLSSCLGRAHIYVRAETAWVENDRERVSGLQLGEVMHLGSDLASLLHETAHMCEELIDMRVDYKHEGWPAAGIWDAEAAYQAWRLAH
jgi:hypothetical protein